MSEFHAAMGLSMLDEIETVLAKREEFTGAIMRHWRAFTRCRCGRRGLRGTMPTSRCSFLRKMRAQDPGAPERGGIFPRRYFYPSLDTRGYDLSDGENPISRDRASRVLCLPMYPALPLGVQDKIVSIMTSYLEPQVKETPERSVHMESDKIQIKLKVYEYY